MSPAGKLARPALELWISTLLTWILGASYDVPESSLYTKQRWQIGQRRYFAVGFARQTLGPLAVAIAPNDAHPERRGGVGIPAIGRLKRDRLALDSKAADGKLIDACMRLIDAHLLNREHDIKQMSDPRICYCALEHIGRAIREHGRFEPRRLQALERFCHLGERVEREIQIHQPVTKSVARQAECLHREVQCITGDSPKIGVLTLERTEPSVLK